jgi:hypothetical protein
MDREAIRIDQKTEKEATIMKIVMNIGMLEAIR